MTPAPAGDDGAAPRTGPSRPGPAAAVLRDASRLLRPALAVAAILWLFVLVPGRSPHPAVQTAEVFLADGLGVRAEWLRWSLLQQHPEPAELVVRVPDLPAPLPDPAP